MTSGVPTSANQFIEQQLDQRLAALEQAFDAHGFCMVGPILPGLDDFVRAVVEERRIRDSTGERLMVLLTTNGGSIETVSRVVDVFRRYYQYVGFVIPNYAFSAGTVLAMSGDDIFMDYYSRFGPIDPQVQNAKGRWVPALGYLIQWQRLLAKADQGTLTLAEIQLMISGFDQAELYQYEQARELSITLLKEWLVTYKFKNWQKTQSRGLPVTAAMRKRRAEAIARALNYTDRWHSHGYGISSEVLRRELRLVIEDLDQDPVRRDLVRQYDGLVGDYRQKLGLSSMLHAVGQFLPLV